MDATDPSRRTLRFLGWFAAVALVSTVSLPLPAAAQQGYQPPFIELGLGATNMTATAGNGSLTAGFSKDGDLTVLSWPSPSYYDQLHYITTNAPDAREQPRYGAPKRAGAFAGLIVQKQGQANAELTWLRQWDRSVTYAQDDVRIVETTFTNSSRGLEVVQRDSIAPDHDVLVRRYRVSVTGNTKYQRVDLVGYSNLTPNLSKVPQVPLFGTLADHKNDFLAVWNQSEDAIVHFQPEGDWVVSEVDEGLGAVSGTLGRKFGPLGKQLQSQTPDPAKVDMLANNLDGNYAEGVYVAMGADPAPTAHQVGEDQTKFCEVLAEIAENIQQLTQKYPDRDLPADPSVAQIIKCGDFDPVDNVRKQENWKYTAQDAFTDVEDDAALSGDDVAGGQVNTALRVPVLQGVNESQGEASLYYAFGPKSSKALSELNWARNQGAQAIEQNVVQNDESYIGDLWIPKEIDGTLEKFIKRAFLNLAVGTDDETGAIVASISRQPSYQLDWPRDGAFFNTALDLAGQHELVTKRMEFYSNTIRDEAKERHMLLNTEVPGWPGKPNETDYPPDSWEMNYYADGVPGGNIRLEIDNTALLVWAYVAHAGFLSDSKREKYLDDVWPIVKRATDFVASWRDPETGLMWPANEDDHATFTQGLQGAITSYRALVAAARVAKHRGKDQLADEWLHRAGELHAATMHYMADEEHGFIDYEEKGAAAGRAWLAWPTRFLPFDNQRLVDTTQTVLDNNLKRVRGKDGNGLYPTKVAIGAALAFSEKKQREKSLEIANRLASKIANQKTFTIGETFVPVDDDGDGTTDRWMNAVSTPHLWSATLVYIAAVAYHHPEKFDPHDDVLPEVTVPQVTPPGVSGGDAGDAGDTGDVADVGTADAGGSGGGGDGGGCSCAASSTQSPVGPIALFVMGVALLRLWRRRDGR